MGKGRLEAFSDGVMAIIITIMVLELKVPELKDSLGETHHTAQLTDLVALVPVFSSYVLSFIYAGIYWNNHHHLFQVVHRVTGGVLWANLHLLFWLSLTPFTTAWMGENLFQPAPVILYGVVLFGCAISYYLLTLALLAQHPKDSPLARALGCDFKGKISIATYALAIGLTFVNSWLGVTLYFVVALIWLIPDRRMERILADSPNEEHKD